MTMKQWLLKRIKKLFENIESTITTVIVLALLGGSIGILALSKKALNVFLQIANIPTPLWATIAVVFLVMVYIYLRTKRVNSLPPPKYKTEHFTINNLKWETKVYDYGSFEVENTPICSEHDLPFIYGDLSHDSSLISDNSSRYCPEFEKGNCENRIWDSEYDKIYATAKSYIDKQIRNKKC